MSTRSPLRPRAVRYMRQQAGGFTAAMTAVGSGGSLWPGWIADIQCRWWHRAGKWVGCILLRLQAHRPAGVRGQMPPYTAATTAVSIGYVWHRAYPSGLTRWYARSLWTTLKRCISPLA